MPRAKYTREQAIAAFWSKVDVRGPDECWEWQGAKFDSGYGQASRLEGQGTRAHRLAFFLSGGYLPERKDVCHTCDNRRCCNPSHLFAGSQKANMEDCVNKGRFADKRGEKNNSAKLTPEAVVALRHDSESGISTYKLGEKYGISQSQAWNIVSRASWRHLGKEGC